MLLAIGGAVLALKRDWRKSLPLIIFALLVWLFMGKQLRFYARWMMPIYPVLALLAGYAAVEAAKALTGRFAKDRGAHATTAVAVAIMAIALIGPLVHVVHNNKVLTKTDTRELAKQWLVENVPPGQKVAIDLLGPPAYYDGLTIRPLPRGKEVENYAKTLSPALIDQFEKEGYCYVVSGSIQKGRVTKDPKQAPSAAAYYKALAERAELVASFSPMKPGAKLPKFNFDISYNYFPLGYARPGPQVDIYRLSGGRCE
jgi:hypothetical protein